MGMEKTTIRIAIGSDHGGIDLKSHIISHLSETQPHTQIQDVGTHNPDSVDYPDYAEKVTQAITQKEADLGILVCGTGIGMSIKANRTNGIRAALVFSDFSCCCACSGSKKGCYKCVFKASSLNIESIGFP